MSPYEIESREHRARHETHEETVAPGPATADAYLPPSITLPRTQPVGGPVRALHQSEGISRPDLDDNSLPDTPGEPGTLPRSVLSALRRSAATDRSTPSAAYAVGFVRTDDTSNGGSSSGADHLPAVPGAIIRRLAVDAVKPLADNDYAANSVKICDLAPKTGGSSSDDDSDSEFFSKPKKDVEDPEEIVALRKGLEDYGWKLCRTEAGHCYTAVEGDVTVKTDDSGDISTVEVSGIRKVLYYNMDAPWLDLLHEQDHINQYEEMIRPRLEEQYDNSGEEDLPGSYAGKYSWEIDSADGGWRRYGDTDYLNAHILTEWAEFPKREGGFRNEGYSGSEASKFADDRLRGPEFKAVQSSMLSDRDNDILELHAYMREYVRLVRMGAPHVALNGIVDKIDEHQKSYASGLWGDSDWKAELTDPDTDNKALIACNKVQEFQNVIADFEDARGQQ